MPARTVPSHSILPHPIDVPVPDIGAYAAGNTGVDYVTSFDSGVAGPHAMIAALVHGNEICGATALDFLMRHEVRPVRGRLTCAFMNVEAYRRFDQSNPTAARFVDEDLNRLWSPEILDGQRNSAELARARAVRPILDTVDFLLDIHSMQHRAKPLSLSGPLPKGRELAHSVGVPEVVVMDEGHSSGRRMRDYQGFADPDSAKNALLVECGQHWQESSGDVAIETCLRFLWHLEMLSGSVIAAHLPARPPAPQKIIEVTDVVTIQSGDFRFARNFRGLEVIPEAGTLIGYDGGRPVVTPYDQCVLVMPTHRLGRGHTAVRLGHYVGPEQAAAAD
ncbi:MAG: M14 family metallopeptidase [Alphaproteobacteria bacterium]|nr:M14 family metallopeptidase [Alphaproteobacteria bacterium]